MICVPYGSPSVLEGGWLGRFWPVVFLGLRSIFFLGGGGVVVSFRGFVFVCVFLCLAFRDGLEQGLFGAFVLGFFSNLSSKRGLLKKARREGV